MTCKGCEERKRKLKEFFGKVRWYIREWTGVNAILRRTGSMMSTRITMALEAGSALEKRVDELEKKIDLLSKG